MTIRNSARLFHHVFYNMGDLHLVLPALNLSTLDHKILVSAQGPLVLGFGLKGLGLRVWGQVLTIVTRACIVSCYDLIGLRNRLYHDGAERGEGRTL